MPVSEPTIDVQEGGPYMVRGDVPIARTSQVATDEGEPLVWRTGEVRQQDGGYALCRCGRSSDKPFCDGTHADVEWDGEESAPTDAYADRAEDYAGTGMVMHDDRGICEHAGFCATAKTNAWKMMSDTDDTATRSQAMAMVERCPSGALTYSVEGERIEPDLPTRVNVIEDGPLWVTGGIPVERADGEPLETRNRMTLCRCGASGIKPLCDGSHEEIGFTG